MARAPVDLLRQFQSKHEDHRLVGKCPPRDRERGTHTHTPLRMCARVRRVACVRGRRRGGEEGGGTAERRPARARSEPEDDATAVTKVRNEEAPKIPRKRGKYMRSAHREDVHPPPPTVVTRGSPSRFQLDRVHLRASITFHPIRDHKLAAKKNI